jgi:hypothetical protein
MQTALPFESLQYWCELPQRLSATSITLPSTLRQSDEVSAMTFGSFEVAAVPGKIFFVPASATPTICSAEQATEMKRSVAEVVSLDDMLASITQDQLPMLFHVSTV